MIAPIPARIPNCVVEVPPDDWAAAWRAGAGCAAFLGLVTAGAARGFGVGLGFVAAGTCFFLLVFFTAGLARRAGARLVTVFVAGRAAGVTARGAGAGLGAGVGAGAGAGVGLTGVCRTEGCTGAASGCGAAGALTVTVGCGGVADRAAAGATAATTSSDRHAPRVDARRLTTP
jgi:hypothetical protein